MTTSCTCPVPNHTPNPRKAGSCVKCGKGLDTDWVSSDANMAAFFNRLTVPSVPATFSQFRVHCERRERAGRDTFGFRYLRRNNRAEGLEEAADLALYAYLDWLQAKRDGRGEDDIDLALQAAYFAAKAYDALLHLEHKRQGEP